MPTLFTTLQLIKQHQKLVTWTRIWRLAACKDSQHHTLQTYVQCVVTLSYTCTNLNAFVGNFKEWVFAVIIFLKLTVHLLFSLSVLGIMSSLAAARADNFYFPPEWTPQMGGISKFQGSKGANQYEQKGIIRFELPFDGWCLGCGVHMTKGLRFNAKKEKEGKYFTTQIWSFHMK